MSKRRHGDTKKANAAAIAPLVRSSTTTGKSITQLQAERIAEGRLADMMSAAGVPVNRIALELLYYLPRDFLETYAELFRAGLVGDDGQAGQRGQANQATADLGRAHRKTSGGAGKKWKKYWTVLDDEALEEKSKVDKRLRAIGRDIRLFLEEKDTKGSSKGMAEGGNLLAGVGRGADGSTGGRTPGRTRRTCGGCRGFVAIDWKYCARCGSGLG